MWRRARTIVAGGLVAAARPRAEARARARHASRPAPCCRRLRWCRNRSIVRVERRRVRLAGARAHLRVHAGRARRRATAARVPRRERRDRDAWSSPAAAEVVLQRRRRRSARRAAARAIRCSSTRDGVDCTEDAARAVLRAANARADLGALRRPLALARGDDRRPAGVPVARDPSRRRAAFLSRAGGRAVHRRRRALQAQRVPLAPHRRPGVAAGRARAIPRSRRAASTTRAPTCDGRRVRGAPVRHRGAGDRPARARDAGAARVSAARVRARDVVHERGRPSRSRATCWTRRWRTFRPRTCTPGGDEVP